MGEPRKRSCKEEIEKERRKTARRKAVNAEWSFSNLNFSNLQNKAARLGRRIGIGFQQHKIKKLNLNSAFKLSETQIQLIVKNLRTRIRNW